MKRIKELIAYYDRQTEDEEAAEYETSMRIDDQSVMVVPSQLVPRIRRLIAEEKQRSGRRLSGRS
jgi:hypothetical protein